MDSKETTNLIKQFYPDWDALSRLNKDRYVCKMCGEPPYSTEDASMIDIDYCIYCKDHTEFVKESELEDENIS
jgi:hypothetical protein